MESFDRRLAFEQLDGLAVEKEYDGIVLGVGQDMFLPPVSRIGTCSALMAGQWNGHPIPWPSLGEGSGVGSCGQGKRIQAPAAIRC